MVGGVDLPRALTCYVVAAEEDFFWSLNKVRHEVEQLAASRGIGAVAGALLEFGDAELAYRHRIRQHL